MSAPASTPPAPGKPPSLASSAISNVAVLALSVAIGIFMTPAILAHLGETRYGIWALVSSVVGYFGMLELGVSTGVFRYVPLYRAKGDTEKLSATISTAVAFNLGVGILAALLAQLFAQPLAVFFEGGEEFAGLIRVIGLAVAFDLPSVAINAAIKGHEGFKAANVATTFGIVLKASLLTACLVTKASLVVMGGAILLVSVSALITQTIAFRKVCPELRLSPRCVRWSELRLLLAFGGTMLIASTANSMATEAPKQIVAKVISLGAVTFLTIPMQLVSYYRQLVYTLTRVVAPRFSFLSGQAADAEVARLFVRCTRYIAIIAGGIALWFWVAGPSFITLWTRKPEMAQAGTPLLVLVTATLVLLSNRVCWDLMLGLGLQKRLALFELAEGLGIALLTYLGSRWMGILGAGIGIALPLVAIRGVWQVHYVCRVLHLSFASYYRQCILVPWLLAGALTGAAYLVRIPSVLGQWHWMILLSAVLMGAYTYLAYLSAIDAEERRHVDAKLASLLRRFRQPATG